MAHQYIPKIFHGSHKTLRRALLHTQCKGPYDTSDYWSSDMLRVNFFKKGFWLVSEPHFVHDFSRKYVSCFILLTDQISLSDFLYFLRYLAIMGIVIACYRFVMS